MPPPQHHEITHFLVLDRPGSFFAFTKTMIRSTTLAATLLATTLAPAAGCLLENPGTPLLEAADVRIDTPGANGFRQAGERGEVYDMALEVSDDVNGWVTEIAVGMSKIVHELDKHPADRKDGEWRVYGPHDDEDGKDGSWMARTTGDANGSNFEVYIGRRGASEDDMKLLIDGDISVVDNQRDGSFTIDFDTIHAYADILDEADPEEDFGGKITVEFERDTDTDEKRIGLDFDGFYFDDGTEALDFDGENYLYYRGEEGGGRFHFATWSAFDDNEGEWSGPELERMTVDMRWNADEAGRARGQILEVDGVGDLRHGDISVSECFDSTGGLTWRALNEPYTEYEPDYSFGDEGTCVYADTDLQLRE